MNNILIRNYAAALFANTIDLRLREKVLKQLTIITECLSEDTIKETMNSPIINKVQKNQVIQALASKLDIEAIVQQFLLLLVKNAHVYLLSQIVHTYKKLIDDSKNIKMVHITSSKILSKEELDQIKTSLESDLNQKIEVELFQDKSIIGGIVVRYDSKLIDYSIAGALSKLTKTGANAEINWSI